MAASNEFTGKKLQTGIPSAEYSKGYDLILENSPRSFPEDYSQENGKNQNRCVKCRNLFLGNKDKIVCRICLLD